MVEANISKKKKKLRLNFKLLLGFIILVIGGFLGIRYYLQLTKKPTNIYDFIPEHTFTILQINDLPNFSNFILKNNFFSDFENLLNINFIRKKISFADSIFSTNEDLKKWWYNSISIISTHFIGEGKFEVLFIKPIENRQIKNKLYSLILKLTDSVEVISLSRSTKVLRMPQHPLFSKNYICLDDEVFLYSSSLTLINKSLETPKIENKIYNDTTFQKVFLTAGKNIMANIFLNYSFFNRYLHTIMNKEYLRKFDFLDNIALWGSYDIFVKDDKIIFNGYTLPNKEASSFFKIFENVFPQEFTISSVLPSNTISFLWLGIDDYLSFRKKYSQYLSFKHQREEFEERLQALKSNLGVAVDELIFPYIDNEILLASTTSLNEPYIYAIIETKETEKLIENIITISKTAAVKFRKKFEVIDYRNYKIIEVYQQYFLYNLFGDFFKPLENSYMTFVNNYWITANSLEAIEAYLNSIIANRVINLNPFYVVFSETIGSQANIYVYTSPRNKIRSFIKYLEENIGMRIIKNITEFSNLEGLALQFSASNNGMFFSTLSFYRTTERIEEALSGWQIALEDKISAGPFFVSTHTDKNKYIIVFDIYNNMYFISNKGEVLWKIPLPEKPISKIYCVDAYRNNKIQYLFNSENYLFLVDRLGNFVENYPLSLPQKANSPISVFDYDNKKDYRVVFSAENNKIYNYTIEGKPVKGWLEPQVNDEVKTPIHHFKLLNTDFIVVRELNNRVRFFNRKGVSNLEFPINIKLGEYSFITPDQEYCKCFISTTNEGQIFKLELNGNIQLSTLREFSKGHVFLYNDFNQDKEKDYIFIDNGKVYIYNLKEELIITFDVDVAISRKIFFIDKSPFGPLFMSHSSDGKKIYLFNNTIDPTNYSYPADNNADWYFDEKNNILYLITSFENILYFNVIE